MARPSYDTLIGLRETTAHHYGEKDTLLYALAIGLGSDPLDTDALAYVIEGGAMQVAPSQAIVLAPQQLIWSVGLDSRRFVHAGVAIRWHRPLAPAADIVAEIRVAEIYDKGDKGAIIEIVSDVTDRATGHPLYSLSSRVFARGDGHLGGPVRPLPAGRPLPTRLPDAQDLFLTRPDQALLYRLTGDRNLLHADPARAQALGFPRPILHGACTFGIACRALLRRYCDYDAGRLAAMELKFGQPFYPGEQLRIDLWHEDGGIAFRGVAEERDKVVIDQGWAEIRA